MRLWWKNLVAKARENRRQILAVSVVVLCVGLLLYGYTLSMRAAFLRMLEDLQVVHLVPPQDDEDNGQEQPVQPVDPVSSPEKPTTGPDDSQVPAFTETFIDLEGLRLAWPLLGGDIMTTFGWNYSETFADWRYHNGIDIKGNAGQMVRAAREGVVIQAGECQWFGQVVLIQHEAGLNTLYGHLGEIMVSVGQTVESEELIAHLGPVGLAERAEGEDFLHFEVLVQGESVDPMEFLR